MTEGIVKHGRAADPTRDAKRAAARVRRCAADLTTALANAELSGLTVAVSCIGFEKGASAVRIEQAREVCVADIEAKVSL